MNIVHGSDPRKDYSSLEILLRKQYPRASADQHTNAVTPGPGPGQHCHIRRGCRVLVITTGTLAMGFPSRWHSSTVAERGEHSGRFATDPGQRQQDARRTMPAEALRYSTCTITFHCGTPSDKAASRICVAPAQHFRRGAQPHRHTMKARDRAPRGREAAAELHDEERVHDQSQHDRRRRQQDVVDERTTVPILRSLPYSPARCRPHAHLGCRCRSPERTSPRCRRRVEQGPLLHRWRVTF